MTAPADDLRAMALGCARGLWQPLSTEEIIRELLAENDRLTAERDKWERTAAYMWSERDVNKDAEIDRLRTLAAALEAEVARADERVAELDAAAAYGATT